MLLNESKWMLYGQLVYDEIGNSKVKLRVKVVNANQEVSGWEFKVQ